MFKRLLILILIFWAGFWLYGKFNHTDTEIEDMSDKLKNELESEMNEEKDSEEKEAEVTEKTSKGTNPSGNSETEETKNPETKNSTNEISSDEPERDENPDLIEVKNPIETNNPVIKETEIVQEAEKAETTEGENTASKTQEGDKVFKTQEAQKVFKTQEAQKVSKNTQIKDQSSDTALASVNSTESTEISPLAEKTPIEAESSERSEDPNPTSEENTSTEVEVVENTKWPAAQMTTEAPDARIKIYLYEWGIDVSSKTVSAKNVEFKVINSGRFAHNFSLKDASGEIMDIGGKVLPGSEAYYRVAFLPGDFEIFSAKNQDYKKGMQETFMIR